MERAIKFRAWVNNGMVYSDNIYGDVDDEYLIALNGDMVYMKKESNGNYCPESLTAKLINEKILMQFTGLKDKNAWECDIVGQPRVGQEHEVIGVIKFDTDLAAFIIEKTNGGWEYLAKHFMENKQHEIIGNIYEHPALLAELDKPLTDQK